MFTLSSHSFNQSKDILYFVLTSWFLQIFLLEIQNLFQTFISRLGGESFGWVLDQRTLNSLHHTTATCNSSQRRMKWVAKMWQMVLKVFLNYLLWTLQMSKKRMLSDSLHFPDRSGVSWRVMTWFKELYKRSLNRNRHFLRIVFWRLYNMMEKILQPAHVCVYCEDTAGNHKVAAWSSKQQLSVSGDTNGV